MDDHVDGAAHCYLSFSSYAATRRTSQQWNLLHLEDVDTSGFLHDLGSMRRHSEERGVDAGDVLARRVDRRQNVDPIGAIRSRGGRKSVIKGDRLP